MQPDITGHNAAQIELWNGRGGEIWTRLQARLDELFTPLTAALLAAASPKPGESILDIGCGCGDLTLRLAKACGPVARVKGIDISVPMLERAKAREKEYQAETLDMAPVDWIFADAMLHPFEPCADLVISRFGVMFFAEPVAAFHNIRRALKPSGRLALLCWGALADNPWITVPLAATHTLIDPAPPTAAGSPGPFAFADTERVKSILSDAGFLNVTARSVEMPLILGQASGAAIDPKQSAVDAALLLALESGPVAALLRTADEATCLKVREAIAATLQPLYTPDRRTITLGARCWLYEAVAV